MRFSHSPGSSFRRESAQPNNFREVFLPLPFCRVNISRTPTASAYGMEFDKLGSNYDFFGAGRFSNIVRNSFVKKLCCQHFQQTASPLSLRKAIQRLPLASMKPSIPQEGQCFAFFAIQNSLKNTNLSFIISFRKMNIQA